MGMIGNAPYQGVVDTGNILNNAITADKLSSTAIQDKLGFMPQSPSDVASSLANLVNSAPSTLDTLNEIALALGNDANFATTITASIGTKLTKSSNLSDLTDVATARSNLGLGNVENKSSSTIRSEITSLNVTNALGFIPYNSTNPSGFISGITSGMVTTALGYTPVNKAGDTITGSLQVTTSIIAGSGAGNNLIISDGVESAKWCLGTGGYNLAFRKNNGSGTYEDKVVMYAAGYLSIPNQLAFQAVGNSANTAYGNGATFVLQTTTRNVDNRYNTANGYFTAPISGFYQFSYGIYSYTGCQIAFKKNGSDYAPSDAIGLVTVAANELGAGSIGIYLSANDYVGFGFRNGYSGNVYMSHAWFSGYLVG